MSECKRKDKSIMKTSVNLNNCITNDNGVLQQGENGNYQTSCTSCTFSTGKFLNCFCKDFNRNKKLTTFNLDDILDNSNGKFSGCGEAVGIPAKRKMRKN